MTTCVLGLSGLCLCNDCEDPGCEQLGTECVVTADHDTDARLYDGTRQYSWSHISNNGLKKEGDQTINPSLRFLAGFSADSLTVTTADCSLSGVDCDQVVLTSEPQHLTGRNTIHGSVTMGSGAAVTVQDSLSVAGAVAGVDVTSLYSDTLLLDSATPQEVTGLKTFTEDISVAALVTGGNTLTAEDGTVLAPCSQDTVLRSETAVVDIAGNLEFDEKIAISKFNADSSDVTWDGVSMGNFFNNLLDHGSTQTITGNVNFANDVTIVEGLQKAPIDGAVNMINGVDIVDIDNRALRVSGVAAESLDDVTFGEIEVTAAEGILLDGTFLGVDLAADAVTKTRTSTLEIHADHSFASSVSITGNVALGGDIVSVSDSSNVVNKNELWNFLDGDSSVTKIKISHSEGGRASSEPTISQVH